MSVLEIVGVVLVVLVAVGWYLSYTAARLDRLHGKVEGALSALDAALVRRAEATLELANAGVLDPASGLILADAAAESLEHTNGRRLESDLLDGQHFAGREACESALSDALALALAPETVPLLRSGPAAPALDRVAAAGTRVQLARRFLNDAVSETQRARSKPLVRVLRLAGHAGMPMTVDFDDRLPAGLRADG